MSTTTLNEPASAPLASSVALTGVLHVYVAFDWGEELDLEQARRLVPAEIRDLPRRRRTPSSIVYRPPPLRIALPPVALDLPEAGTVQATAEATVFDFAGVSLALHVPFSLTADALSRLAGWLADSTPLLKAARATLDPLHKQLLPALHDPLWTEDLNEEYLVFQLPPSNGLEPTFLVDGGAGWLAGLVRLEAGPLSAAEIKEALRLHIGYSPADMFIPDWAAGFLLDHDCDETLQTIEFANLQLLEYRHIDNRLDDALAGASRLTEWKRRSWLRFFRSYDRPLRTLGELKVEANGLFERTGNALKLLGDQYLARVYRLAATRFHLKEWERNIQRKLEVAEGVYQVVSDQAVSYRMEFLEIIVILLITLEIVLTLARHH
jgi:hypothetical protein